VFPCQCLTLQASFAACPLKAAWGSLRAGEADEGATEFEDTECAAAEDGEAHATAGVAAPQEKATGERARGGGARARGKGELTNEVFLSRGRLRRRRAEVRRRVLERTGFCGGRWSSVRCWGRARVGCGHRRSQGCQPFAKRPSSRISIEKRPKFKDNYLKTTKSKDGY
jgi:hypothetical protein